MRRREFELAVQKAVDELPTSFRRVLRYVVLEVRDWPSQKEVQDAGARSRDELFGFYVGTPLTERTVDYGMVVPDKILIFQRPLESAYRRRRDLLDQIKITVRHEVGHHFGMSEQQLAQRGYD